MKLAEFRRIWADCNMIESDRREAHGATWILYKVTEPDSTSEYGRHYALYVALNPVGQIIAHNLKNTSSGSSKSWTEQVYEWWERHVEEGLVAPSGEPIPLEVN